MSALKIKRGSTASVNAYTPLDGELVLDTTLMQLRLGDGLTPGGINTTNASTALKLAVARNIALAGAVSGTIPFDGSADVSIVTTLANSIGLTGTPTAPTAAVGTSTTQIATTAMLQAEIANKRAWTSYTPTVVAGAGTFTTATATGSFMEAFGVRHLRVAITITTKGTGTLPTFTLPVPALAGSASMPCFTAFKAAGGRAGTGRVQAGLTAVSVLGVDGLDLLTADGDVIFLYGSYPVA